MTAKRSAGIETSPIVTTSGGGGAPSSAMAPAGISPTGANSMISAPASSSSSADSIHATGSAAAAATTGSGSGSEIGGGHLDFDAAPAGVRRRGDTLRRSSGTGTATALGGRASDSNSDGNSASTRADGGVELGRIGVDVALVLQRPHPAPEIRLGDVEEMQHRGRDVALFLEQTVVNLLDVVRELAQLVQADHPAAALDRMELPPRRAQRLAIAEVPFELCAILEHLVEHLGGLDEEDLHQLGVETIGVRREQPLGLGRQRGRGRRRRRAALGDRADRRLERDRAFAVGPCQRLELGQRFLRLGDELRVVDERGVVDEVLELRGQRRAGRGVGRCAPDLRDELAAGGRAGPRPRPRPSRRRGLPRRPAPRRDASRGAGR